MLLVAPGRPLAPAQKVVLSHGSCSNPVHLPGIDFQCFVPHGPRTMGGAGSYLQGYERTKAWERVSEDMTVC